MNITFTPMRSDAPLTLERQGDSLIVNGTRFDFSQLPDGALLPAQAIVGVWPGGDVIREGGVLHIPVILPHAADAPAEARTVRTVCITADGPIALSPSSEV